MFPPSTRMRAALVQALVPLSLAIVLGCAGACGQPITLYPASHQVYNATKSNKIAVGFSNYSTDPTQYTIDPGLGTDVKYIEAKYGILSADGSPTEAFDLNYGKQYFSVFFEDPSASVRNRYRIVQVGGPPGKAGIYVAHCNPLIAKTIDVYVVPTGTAITPGSPTIAGVPFDNTWIHRGIGAAVKEGFYDIMLTPSGSSTVLSKNSAYLSGNKDYIVVPFQQGGVSKKPLVIRYFARLDTGRLN